MARGELTPWKWGSLRWWDRDEPAATSFRSQMESLHREMDRLFDGLWTGGAGTSLLSEDWTRRELVPQLDVTEDDKAFAVNVELPGMDQKDVEVTFSDRVLTIRGEKKEDKETREKDFYRRECAYGSFRRSIEIPASVEAEKIQAKFDKGVLRIELPKTKEAQEKTRHIEVKAA